MCTQCSNNNSSRSPKSNCKGCVCDQLKRLPVQTEVDVFLKSGTILEDVVFIFLDQNNCCAFFTDTETEPGSTLIVDCRDIQALRIEAN